MWIGTTPLPEMELGCQASVAGSCLVMLIGKKTSFCFLSDIEIHSRRLPYSSPANWWWMGKLSEGFSRRSEWGGSVLYIIFFKMYGAFPSAVQFLAQPGSLALLQIANSVLQCLAVGQQHWAVHRPLKRSVHIYWKKWQKRKPPQMGWRGVNMLMIAL